MLYEGLASGVEDIRCSPGPQGRKRMQATHPGCFVLLNWGLWRIPPGGAESSVVASVKSS